MRGCQGYKMSISSSRQSAFGTQAHRLLTRLGGRQVGRRCQPARAALHSFLYDRLTAHLDHALLAAYISIHLQECASEQALHGLLKITSLAKVPRGYAFLLVAGSSLLQAEGSGRLVHAKRVGQINGLAQ